jgi:V/A-type H+-transporting ATPase subunit I
MSRVAIVAATSQLRRVLVEVADAGVVQVETGDEVAPPGSVEESNLLRSRYDTTVPGAKTHPVATLALEAPELSSLTRPDESGMLLGEVELERVMTASRGDGGVTALAGWCPTPAIRALAARLAPLGGAVVELPFPPGSEPPTLVEASGATRAFQPLVDTYSILPYADLDPASVAGLAYVVMFGMMFGDVGHGALLVIAGILLARRRPRAFARFHSFAPFVMGAGIASCIFGLAFGEMFGPTHVVPTLWIAPLNHATTLLAVAVAAGAGLLTIAYVLGTVNRFREGGAGRALLAVSGFAGTLLYLGLAVVGLGWYRHARGALIIGAALALLGLGLAFAGLFKASEGRFGGVLQAGIETFDSLIRIGTNTMSFARLAAFGLTHAALCGLIWSATTALEHRGLPGVIAGVAVFLVGNTVAFALEGLVAGIQALRLEYYELFSRILVNEGHQFRPWHVPILSTRES